MRLKSKYITLSKEQRLYQTPCPVIGLTGGIATGKSTVSSELEKQGIPIICADKLVKKVYKSDKTVSHLIDNYPSVIENGVVDFKELRKLFFENKNIQADIEKLIYSQMPEAFNDDLSRFNKPEVIIYDVPLLFEKGLDKLVDLKVCVYAPADTQVKRLIERDHIDEALAKEIISKQLPINEKKNKSDVIIENDKGLTELKENIRAFIEQTFN